MSEPAEQMRPMRRRRHSRAAVDLRGVPYQSGPLDDSGGLLRSAEPPDTNPQGLFGIPRSVLPARSRATAASSRTLYPVTPSGAGQPAAPDDAANPDDESPDDGPDDTAAPSTRAAKAAGAQRARNHSHAQDQPPPAEPEAAFSFVPPAANAPFDVTPPADDSPFQFIPAADDSPFQFIPATSEINDDVDPFAFTPAAPPEQVIPAPVTGSLFRRVDPSWRAVVALSVVLGALGGAAWGLTHPPQYSGRADFVIDATVDLTGAPATALQQATDRDVATQAVLLGNQGVQATAIAYLGTKAFEVKTRSDKDSNVISVSVTAPTYAQTRSARAAYTKAYLNLVSKQQSKLLEPQVDVAAQAAKFDQTSLAKLDADLKATPKTQQTTVIATQTAQRASITGDLRENQQRLARLVAARRSLPVNVHPLPEETPIEPSGLGALQWTALGLTLGAGTGAVISLRLAERRSLAQRLL